MFAHETERFSAKLFRDIREAKECKKTCFLFPSAPSVKTMSALSILGLLIYGM